MDRIEIIETLLLRGAAPQEADESPDVGGSALRSFYEHFASYAWPLGNSVLSGYNADQFSQRWREPDPLLTQKWEQSYVPGRDVSGIRRFASDEFSLLVDASDPDGELFVDGHDENRGGIVRSTGVSLWGWLERLAGLLMASPSSNLSFDAGTEIPGNGQFEAAIWFAEPWEVVAVVDVDELAIALVGAGRYRRDLPKMAESEFVAQTFALCPEELQLKLTRSLDAAWDREPLISNSHLSEILSRGFSYSNDVVDALRRLGS